MDLTRHVGSDNIKPVNVVCDLGVCDTGPGVIHEVASLPKSTIAPLRRVQNAATRLITGIGRRDHVTPALQ